MALVDRASNIGICWQLVVMMVVVLRMGARASWVTEGKGVKLYPKFDRINTIHKSLNLRTDRSSLHHVSTEKR